tara:strand:- start:2004 stop:2360 length:357 start_codon:yes stop_codon:yes gene_type:complete
MDAKTDTIETTTNVTKMEYAFIEHVACSDFTSENWNEGIRGYVCESEGFDMKKARGVMSSLVQKGIIFVDAEVNQWCPGDDEYRSWVAVKCPKITKMVYEDFITKGWVNDWAKMTEVA